MTRRLIKEYDLTRAFADRSSVLSPNNYSIESANNLRLWAKMTAGAPTDLGLCNLSPSYDNNASVSNALIGNRVYSALNCSDSAGQRAQVTATNGALSFSTVASGVAPTAASDLPFSISCWINVTSLSSTVHIFGKDGGAGTDVEYKARVYSTGAVNFELHDEDAGGAVYEGVGTPSSTITTNQWYHVVFTYDGRGGASANAGMNIYVDGVKKNSSTTTGGVYVGMQPFHDLPLYIGADGDTSDEMDGQIAEFAAWGVELSLEEINAIYSSTREDSYAELSGIISNPARVRQQIKDSYTGSYPPVLPTGNPDYTGNNLSIFDDTDTIIFQGGNTVYPTNLPAGSKFLSGGVATPNILEGITTAGTASAGIFDSNITIFAGPTGSTTFGPFVEDRTYLDNDADFYATGTASGTLPGFDQRLSSKIAIVLDTNPSQATSFFFSTGTAPNASGYDAGVNTSMGYFSWTDKKWEIIGDLSSGSNIDLLNQAPSIRRKGLLGFCPSNLVNAGGELISNLVDSPGEAIIETVGSPMSEYGFPFASKYDASGSQMMDMSKYINEPFLLEKATIEFSGTFGPHIIHSTQFGPVVKTFFLMTQKNVSGSSSPFETDILSGANPGVAEHRSYAHGYAKSLVGYGQVSLVYSDCPSQYNRDLSVTVPGSSIRRTAVTGTYKIEFLPKSVQKNEYGGATSFSPSPGSRYTSPGTSNRELLRIHGGRSGFDLSDGRSFIAGVGGLTPTGSYELFFKQVGTTNNKTIIANKKETIARTSPFLLTPQDKLIFGFANTPNYYGVTQYALNNSKTSTTQFEAGLAKEEVILSPGSGKVTLYGTLLRDNLPAEGNSNEYLTSDAIHEDVRSDIPVYDQWDVEPFSTLTGSYVDNILTGSMFGGTNAGFNQEFADGTAAGVRIVVASVAAGNAGVTGSLQRFVRLTDKNEKAYDSYPPNPVDVLNKEGVGILWLGASNGYPGSGCNWQSNSTQCRPRR